MTKTKKELREEIKLAYSGILSDKQIETTIKWWNKKLDEALKANEDERLRVIEKIKELIKTDGPWTSEYDGYDKAFDKGYNKCLEDVLSILKPNDGRCKCGNPKMDESDFCKDCI